MADEIVVRGSELAAIAAFLERGAGELACPRARGRRRHREVDRLGGRRRRRPGAGLARPATRPARSESGLTLGGLTDLLGGLDDETLARLPGPQRRALGIALLRVEPAGDAAPDQRTLSVAVAGLLRRSPASGPVLLAIDDAQWIDESSAAILAYALRRLADPRRAPRGGRSGPRRRRGRDPGRDAAGSDGAHPLGPMHLAELHRLFLARLGRSFPRLVLRPDRGGVGRQPAVRARARPRPRPGGNPDDPHGRCRCRTASAR